VLAVVPEVGYDDDRDTLELLLATSTRMMGEHGEAKILLERLLARKRSKEVRASTLLDYALCLQSLKDPDALRVANEIIALTPKSYGALQARSIILEVEDDADKESQLLKLEAEARKKGANVVAKALVQIASSAEMLLINMDTLSIEKDSIPDGGRCGVLEPESAEVELPFANAMHRLDS
jgi:hypothetical protein